MAKHFEILFEDEHFIVVNKKAGVLTIPDRYEPNHPNLKGTLSKTRESVFVVHGIDKDTSGLVLFCKTAEMDKAMSLLFEEGKIIKKYRAITQGKPAETEGKVDAAILVPRDKVKVSISPKGKEAVSHYQVLEAFRQFSFLEIQIESWRRHQIRVHLYSISCPIVADKLYGTTSDFYLSQIKKKRFNLKKHEIERPLLSRQALHAFSIEFNHPISKEKIFYEAEPPKDMRAVLTQLRKLNI